MASQNLPVNVDTSYADSVQDPSVKAHQQAHDKIHQIVNWFDKDAAPADGFALVYNAATGLYGPADITGGTGPVTATDYSTAAASTLFVVRWAGGPWPASRPSARTNIYFILTGAPETTANPTWMLPGDFTIPAGQPLSTAQVTAIAQARVDAYSASNPGGGTGVTSHSALSGLANDDHQQYLNTTRGDVRYYTKALADAAIAAVSAADRDRGNHSGTQLSTTISDFAERVQSLIGGVVTPPDEPPPVQTTQMSAFTSDGTITVTWTAASGATGYTVSAEPITGGGYSSVYLENYGGTATAVKSATDISHTFTGLANGSTYLVILTIAPSGVQRSLTATPAASESSLLFSTVGVSTVAESTIEAGHPVSLMTDGNPETRWISQPSSPVSITWDMVGVYDLNRVEIVFAGNTIKNYTVSLSANGSTFTTIATGVTNNSERQVVTISNFTGTSTGRYLRIDAADRWNNSFGNSIWEVSAYGTPNVSAPSGTVAAFAATVASNTAINLAWTYSGSTLSGYTLKRNGVSIATPAAGATSYSDTGLTAGGTYTYTLVGNFQAGGTTNTATTTATTTGGAVSGVGGFGYMVFVQEATWSQDLAATVAAGATWIRMDIPDGSYGTTNSTTRTFTRNTARSDFYKQACAAAKAAGLKICMDMAAFPNNTGWTDAQFAEATANQIRAVSADIGQYVDLWQFFNEHDGNDFRNHSATDLSNAYFGRLRDCLAVLRSAAREFSIAPVTTTTFGYPVNQARYDLWQRFWDVVSPSADVIGIHAYPETNQTTINLLATYMNNLRNRYSKPICILEFGVPKVAGYGTPTQVGDAIVRQIAAIMGTRPICAALYQLRDRGTNPNDTNGEMVFGILENNFTQKSYYNAVRTEALKWK